MADPGFSPGGTPTPKIAIIFQIFAKNCMKMKEFGPRGARVPDAPLGSANESDTTFYEVYIVDFQTVINLKNLSAL